MSLVGVVNNLLSLNVPMVDPNLKLISLEISKEIRARKVSAAESDVTYASNYSLKRDTNITILVIYFNFVKILVVVSF